MNKWQHPTQGLGKNKNKNNCKDDRELTASKCMGKFLNPCLSLLLSGWGHGLSGGT